MNSIRCLIFILSSFWAMQLSAAQITIPLSDPDFKLEPASDLFYQGSVIDAIDAVELKRKGIDLADLNPHISSLFRGTRLDLENKVSISSREVSFHSSLNSPTEFFRASVNIGEGKYTLSASLYNHQTMLRATLLRMLGYDVKLPQFFKELKLKFKTKLEKENFLELLVDSTLLSKTRWVKLEAEKELVLKGVLLEEANIKNVPVYWPVMERTRQIKRRLFRSLLYLYSLTDFPQQINLIPWSFGTTFNNELYLTHPYALSFTNVTIDDLKWMHRKFLKLSGADLFKAVKSANYPLEISYLIFEKLKSRVCEIGMLISEPCSFSYKRKLSYKNVVKGKLRKADYSSYVPEFWSEDPLSPYRFSQLMRLFRSQIAYDTMSGILDIAQEKLLPSLDVSDAADNIRERLNEYRNRNRGEIPLKVWTAPTASGSASASRSIVFGQYQASVAPIQLVDTVGVELKAGLFSLLTGAPSQLTPYGSAGVSIKRTWSHVRAMPDLETATRQKLRKIIVPGLLKKLGSVIDNKFECSIGQRAWVSEEIIASLRTWVVYYDKADKGAKEEALKLREGLIEAGRSADTILLSPVDKEELCQREVSEKISKNLESFIKEFAMGETITITDSLVFNSLAGVKVDIGNVDKLGLDLETSKAKVLLRSFIIRKVAKGIEVSIQTQKDSVFGLNQNLKLFVSLISNSYESLKGELKTKIYNVDLVEIQEEEKKIALKTLKEILLRNSFSHLIENYNPIKLQSDVKLRINEFKFLWFKSEKMRMNHEIEIKVPEKPTRFEREEEEEENVWIVPQRRADILPEEERTRQFYGVMSVKRSGRNYHNFLDNIISELTNSWVSIGSQDQDPGRSIYGRSKASSFFTEAELTEKKEFQLMSKVEFRHIGWRAKSRKINKIIDEFESFYNFEGHEFQLDRSLFNTTKRVMSYDFRSTIILYPSAIEKMKESLFNQKISQKDMQVLYGEKKFKDYCAENEQSLDKCRPSFFKKITRKARGFAKLGRKGKADKVNEVVRLMFMRLEKKNVLRWIGLDHFFATNYLSGYREGDSLGYLQHTSNSIGTFQEDHGVGLLDGIATNLGVTAYTLKALNYMPGVL